MIGEPVVGELEMRNRVPCNLDPEGEHRHKESLSKSWNQCKCHRSEGKVCGQSGVKEDHKVPPHKISHRRFTGRKEPRRMTASAQARSSRELNRRQGLYRDSWGQSFLGWRFPG